MYFFSGDLGKGMLVLSHEQNQEIRKSKKNKGHQFGNIFILPNEKFSEKFQMHDRKMLTDFKHFESPPPICGAV